MAKFIEFQEFMGDPPEYVVISKEQKSALGSIFWFKKWRKYVYQPNENTIYEEICFRDLAAFLEEKTRAVKANK